MSDMQPSDSSNLDRKARLRRRLAGGIFTALLTVHGLGAGVAGAQTSPAGERASKDASTSITARAEQVRNQIATDDTSPGLAWGNGWYNWRNGWHNWRNHWNNWHNDWNNWNNWNNGWYNF